MNRVAVYRALRSGVVRVFATMFSWNNDVVLRRETETAVSDDEAMQIY